MAFINEIMPDDEKEKLPFSVSVNADGANPTLWKWTIDRDRQAFLVLDKVSGSQYSDTKIVWHYTFSWKHKLIRLAQSDVEVQEDHRGVVLTFFIHDIEIPDKLKGDEDEVMSLLIEAISVKGQHYDGHEFASVDIIQRSRSAPFFPKSWRIPKIQGSEPNIS